MGNGFTMKCTKCNKEYHFLIGQGMLSFSKDFTNVLYFCKKCNSWEEYKAPFFFDKPFQHLEEIDGKKVFVNDIPEKKCKKCNTKMKYIYEYDYFGPEKNPKLACPDCNTIMNFETPLLWD